MTYKEWQKEEHNYDCITTYWDDFSIADHFGETAIRNTYKQALKNEEGNYKTLTELVIVLSDSLWAHYNNGNEKLARVYDELFKELDGKLCNELKGEELQYFLRTTD